MKTSSCFKCSCFTPTAHDKRDRCIAASYKGPITLTPQEATNGWCGDYTEGDFTEEQIEQRRRDFTEKFAAGINTEEWDDDECEDCD